MIADGGGAAIIGRIHINQLSSPVCPLEKADSDYTVYATGRSMVCFMVLQAPAGLGVLVTLYKF